MFIFVFRSSCQSIFEGCLVYWRTIVWCDIQFCWCKTWIIILHLKLTLFIQVFFNIVSTVIFIAYMQPLSLISLALVGLVMERVRRVYTPAVRDIKRLESLSKSLSNESIEKIDVFFLRTITDLLTFVIINSRCTYDSFVWNTGYMHSRIRSMSRWTQPSLQCYVRNESLVSNENRMCCCSIRWSTYIYDFNHASK